MRLRETTDLVNLQLFNNMGHIDIEEQLAGAATPAPVLNDDEKYEKDLEDGSTSVDLEELAPRDPNIVDWDGPDDPANPQNWSAKKKTITVVLVSSITFVT